jgi:pilus assembly protein CpaE
MTEPIKVLIVDDITSTLDNLQKLLSFEPDIQVVATAVNGKEGVEQAKKLAPDLVLMDVNMPIMDGIQATEILAHRSSSCPSRANATTCGGRCSRAPASS